MSSFGMGHFACLLVRVIAWHLLHRAVITFCLVYDVGTEMPECLLIVCVRSVFAVFPDDAVFGYGSYSGNHTKTYLCGQVLHLQ